MAEVLREHHGKRHVGSGKVFCQDGPGGLTHGVFDTWEDQTAHVAGVLAEQLDPYLVHRIPVPADIDVSPELDALPVETVIFDDDHDVLIKDHGGTWRFWGSFPAPDEEEAVVCLPATVVWLPRADGETGGAQ